MKIWAATLLLAAVLAQLSCAAPQPEAANLFGSFDTGYEPVELVHRENDRQKNKKWTIEIKKDQLAARPAYGRKKRAPEAANLFESFDTGYEPVELVHRENARDKNKKWSIKVGNGQQATFSPFSNRRQKRAPEAANLFGSFDTGYEPVELVHRENDRNKNKKWTIEIKKDQLAARPAFGRKKRAPEAANLFESFDTGYEPVELVHRENARDKNKKWTIKVGNGQPAPFNPFRQ